MQDSESTRERFGQFDDANREYVITTPRTPYPWINYLGMEDFFGLISNTGGGYAFFRDAKLRRILRFRYNGLPLDGNGRYFYLRDGDDVWNPGWQPVQAELDRYECRHGMGYTRILGERGGLRAEVLFFVPPGERCEIHRLALTNLSDQPKPVTLFSFLEFCLWDALDDMTNFQRNLSCGEVEVEGSTIYHKTEYRERRDHYAFYSVNAPVTGFDTDREFFVGTLNGLHRPDAVFGGGCRNSLASGWHPCAAHQLEVYLEPGASTTYLFTLGYIENEQERKWSAPGVINKEGAEALQARFSDPAAVAAALDTLKAIWSDLLGRFSVESGDERLDRMVNIWNPYQCMVTFNMSRSASYFESGIGRGMGFRDSSQDLLGFVHQVPDRARQRILDIAATQFEDGGNWHQYQPLTRKGNADAGSGFNDDPLWLIEGVSAYIRETGDWTILGERVSFDDTGREATLFDHCTASFDHVIHHRGPHGLPLIGRADWNDCLNLNAFQDRPGESFQTAPQREGGVAESVFIAGMFVHAGADYVAMARRAGFDEEAARAERQVEEMRAATLEHGWDGEWFLRAYDHAGDKVGSHECEEGQIFIEPQGFCVMAGIGVEEGKARQALDSVHERLNTPHGIVLLNPPYERYHLELGEVSSYLPGYKENAGIFCHNNPWVMIAETVINRPERAWMYYRQIAPAYREHLARLHRTEPYVYAQMITGKDAPRHGEAKNSWLTGTAAWNYFAVTQHLLGIRPDWDGLRLDPCLEPSMKGFRARRVFRGATYAITVSNPNGGTRGLASLTMDGKPIPGQVLPVAPAGMTVAVEAVLSAATPA